MTEPLAPQPLTANESRVLSEATRLAAGLAADPNHTVAAAVMDARGVVHSAVNVYHFTGGPCAELVALGVAAAAGAGPLMLIAAAGDGGRGAIPPCGRCRQVLLDLHPDVAVLVPGEDEPQVVPIRALLPEGNQHPDARPARLVRFADRYHDAVLAGRKTMTIRHRDPVAPGPAVLAFESEPGCRRADAVVESVQPLRFGDLGTEHARAEAAADVASLRAGLLEHYPGLSDDESVDVVRFHLAD